MKKLLVMIAVMAFAGVAAANSAIGGAPGDVEVSMDRDMFYCQAPSAFASNGSSPFEAEQADDIPDELVGMNFNTVGAYLLMWGGTWMDPDGINISIYEAECPPSYDASMTYYVAWGDMAYTEYMNLSGYDVYYFEALLPDTWTVAADMSVGFQAVISWGQNPPYCGFCATDYEVFGCGEFYWSGDYWGYPRWTPFGDYGYLVDLAYCLGGDTTASGQTDWSQIKSLY